MQMTETMKKYSNNPELLGKVLTSVKIYLECSGIGHRHIGGKECPNRTWKVRIDRNGKSISFEFHDSVASYMAEATRFPGQHRRDNFTGRIENVWQWEDLAYSILCCVGSDGLLEVSSYENFCLELGYDTDSRKALELYLACQEQSGKIHKLFTDEELEAFPN